MLQYIIPASGLLFTLQNIIWINLGVFIGAVFAAIPGLSVILCVILFLPLTYQLTAIPGMMFLLGIYCAGGYGGSVSAILINTPGTPHAAATMLDGHPLSNRGRTKAALKIALYASTFGGVFSALMLLFLGPQVAKIAAQLGTAEYFMVCLFGLTIIAGVSGKSMIRGLISACLGLLISCIGADPMTSYDPVSYTHLDVYKRQQEMHWMRLRQQDPTTKLWSMCEIRTFASQGGERTTVCVEWLYTGATFIIPQS